MYISDRLRPHQHTLPGRILRCKFHVHKFGPKSQIKLGDNSNMSKHVFIPILYIPSNFQKSELHLYDVVDIFKDIQIVK